MFTGCRRRPVLEEGIMKGEEVALDVKVYGPGGDRDEEPSRLRRGTGFDWKAGQDSGRGIEAPGVLGF